MKSCQEHLNLVQKQKDGSTKKYYQKVEESELKNIKNEINFILEEGYENEYLTKLEYEATNPDLKGAAKFYQKTQCPRNIPRTPNYKCKWFSYR